MTRRKDEFRLARMLFTERLSTEMAKIDPALTLSVSMRASQTRISELP